MNNSIGYIDMLLHGGSVLLWEICKNERQQIVCGCCMVINGKHLYGSLCVQYSIIEVHLSFLQ